MMQINAMLLAHTKSNTCNIGTTYTYALSGEGELALKKWVPGARIWGLTNLILALDNLIH